MSEHPIVWAVLAPINGKEMEEAVEDFRPARKGLGEMFQPQWAVMECEGDYSVLLNRTPGTRDTHESAMAQRLSLTVGRPVYVIYPDDDPEEAGVLVYENGQSNGELPENPYDFARRLGCPLPGEPEKLLHRSKPRGVIVAEGSSSADAARVLGYKTPPQDEGDDPRIMDGPVGAVVVREDSGDLAFTAHRLSEGLPGHDVYMVSTGPTPGRFLVLARRDGRTVGAFDYNVDDGGNDPPRLDSIKGKRTPMEIVEALGIEPDMLDLDQSK